MSDYLGGLGTMWTGVTVMADDEMRAIPRPARQRLSRDDHSHRLLHRHDLPPRQTDSVRRRGAFRPVVTKPMTNAHNGSDDQSSPLAERWRQ